MSPRQQAARSAHRSDRSTIIVDHATKTFRPVALPALAAAVQATTTRTSPRTSLLSGTRDTRFEHEDTPLS